MSGLPQPGRTEGMFVPPYQLGATAAGLGASYVDYTGIQRFHGAIGPQKFGIWGRDSMWAPALTPRSSRLRRRDGRPPARRAGAHGLRPAR